MSDGTKESSGAETEREKKGEKRKRAVPVIVAVIILILLFLLLRSCGTGEAASPETERIYEEDSREKYPAAVTAESGKRLSLAVSAGYVISEEHPVFRIGLPKENDYDVVFTLKDGTGKELYRTDYVAPGTHAAIDGTGFLSRGEHRVDCLVSVYDRESGELISDCTTVVLNIKYE